MAVFEKFEKGSIKHYNRFLPKIKKPANFTLIKFWLVFIIDCLIFCQCRKRLEKLFQKQVIFGKWPFLKNFKGVNTAKWSKLIDLSLNFINPVKENVNRRWPFDFVVAQDLTTSFSYTVFIFSSPWIYQQTTFFLSYLGKRKVPFEQVGGYLQIHNLSPDCDRF